MSDFNSSLPVRTQNNGDIAAKIVDGTTTSQALAVDSSGRITTKLDDGAGNALTSQASGAQQALDVGINVSGVQIDPRQIRALTSADVVSVVQSTNPWITKDVSDGSVTGGTAGTFSGLAGAIYNSTLPTLTSGQQAALQLDSSGRLLVDIGTEVGTLATSDAADGPVTPGTAASKSILGGVQYNSTLPTLTTGQQSAIQADSSGRLLVSSIANALPAGTNLIGKIELTDGTSTVGVAPASTAALATQPAEVVALSPNTPLPAGTNALGSVLANIQVGSAAVSNTNPVPVTLTTAAPGLAVQSYGTSASVAAGGTATFTYTVAASHTFNLERVWASGEGKIKVVVNNNGSPIYTGFNSSAFPNVDITVMSPPTIVAGNTVTVVITNNELVASDVYCTIEGNQN